MSTLAPATAPLHRRAWAAELQRLDDQRARLEHSVATSFERLAGRSHPATAAAQPAAFAPAR
ncbi:hypothetical protein HK405_002418, partial [Cladochytrium tenue]